MSNHSDKTLNDYVWYEVFGLKMLKKWVKEAPRIPRINKYSLARSIDLELSNIHEFMKTDGVDTKAL